MTSNTMDNHQPPTIIDGGILEGGGQILRNSIAYSTLLQTPIFIHNIRANREKPGLRPQHLSGLQLVATIASSSLLGGTTPKPIPVKNTKKGVKKSVLPDDAGSDKMAWMDGLGDAKVGCDRILFRPGVVGGVMDGERLEYVADTGTAGSIGLLIQVSLPVLLFASKPSTVVMKGGTNAANAPQIDFTVDVLIPFLRRWCFRDGTDVDLRIDRRGYFPKGGGEVVMTVQPVSLGHTLKAFEVVDRGVPFKLGGRVFVAGNLPFHVAEKMRMTIVETLRGVFSHEVVDRGRGIEVVKDAPGVSVGTAMGCQLWIETTTGCRITGSSLGSPRESAESVGSKASMSLMEQWERDGCCDEYLQDQVIIFMALAEGRSRLMSGRLSLHTETAIHVAREMTGARICVEKMDDGDGDRWMIEVDGSGYNYSMK